MTGQLSKYLFELPQAKAFIERLVKDVNEGRSLLVLLPNYMDPSLIWSLVSGPLERQDLYLRTIRLADIPSGRPPVSAISDALNISWPSNDIPRTPVNLMNADDMPDIVLVKDLCMLSEAGQHEWLEFLSDWDEASQSAIDQGRHPRQLVIIDSASELIPEPPMNSTNLYVHWWWGIPSILEMRLLCRLASNEDVTSPEAIWREHTLPNLAGNDISLMGFLWDRVQLSQEELISDLCSFSDEQGWEIETLRSWGWPDSGSDDIKNIQNMAEPDPSWQRRPPPPPRQLRRLWAEGILSSSLEYGLECNIAALASLGDQEAVRHRIWRGQVELISPILDRLRIEVCEALTDTRHGSYWKERAGQMADGTTDSLFNQEWGEIVYLLNDVPEFRGEKRERRLASVAHRIRNDLYHYETITFDRFVNLDRLIKHG